MYKRVFPKERFSSSKDFQELMLEAEKYKPTTEEIESYLTLWIQGIDITIAFRENNRPIEFVDGFDLTLKTALEQTSKEFQYKYTSQVEDLKEYAKRYARN